MVRTITTRRGLARRVVTARIGDRADLEHAVPMLLEQIGVDRVLDLHDLRSFVDVGRWVYPGPCGIRRVEAEGGSKPVHPDWVRHLRDACARAGVEFCFRGWGDWLPISEVADSDRLYLPNRRAREGEDQGKLDALYGRSCIVPTAAVRFDGIAGDVDNLDAWERRGGFPAYLAFQLGREHTGRTLDGKEYPPR